MKITDVILTEMSLNRPLIVVDVQPAYSGMNDGDEDSVFVETIQMANQHRGPILMFVNAEDQGLTSDTVDDVKMYWEDTGFEPENWSRVTVVDKGYGYLRAWMDGLIDPKLIKQVIREMYRQHVYSSDQLFDGDEEKFMGYIHQVCGLRSIHAYAPSPSVLTSDPISVGWAAVDRLKKFNNCYICGGGANECLREVTLLMNAFNIRYTVLNRYVYGGQYSQT
jgi:hypothetical protein